MWKVVQESNLLKPSHPEAAVEPCVSFASEKEILEVNYIHC